MAAKNTEMPQNIRKNPIILAKNASILLIIISSVTHIKGENFYKVSDEIVRRDETLCFPSKCHNGTASSGLVDFCQTHESPNTEVVDRCCIMFSGKGQHEKNIIGLDWNDCNITSVDELDSLNAPNNTQFNRTQLLYFDLRDNNELVCNDTESFADLTHLYFLSLPKYCHCPGNSEAWNTTKTTTNNTQCNQVLNLCKTQNLSCPSNSSCSLHAPGVSWCLCDEGFHGYKCLRQGDFPAVEVGVSMLAGTLVLSIGSWAAFRRKVLPGY